MNMPKKKDEIIEEINSHEMILENEIEDVLSNGFGRYSKYVLQERAVPDVRDGLKPVQRRIIYTMYLEGNFASKPTRKCARTVGAVIGRFHPHGDTSVYEAMVRLSQDWKMRVPLIDFQGNNGSIDGDGPAAYRYTEARLSEIADEMVRDLNKNTVDMELNFDDQELEPVVLPSRFPNLLVNGSQGVAVGASTDIPPHNLGEVIDGVIYRLNHKRCSISDLMSFIKGPDFPTGGIIVNPQDLMQIYQSGKGLIRLMCRYHTEEGKNLNSLVITEIPYGVEKSSLVLNIAKCRVQNNLDAILDVRDETDKNGLRIVIEVKKDTDIDQLTKFIISKGVLTTSVKFNMLVIDHNRPRTLNLLEAVDCYIEHQIDVITRRSKFDLNKYEERLHIVEGLIKALSILDDVVKTIRQSKDKADARIRLISNFGFSEKQAEALLNLQLYRLSNTDVTTLVAEGKDLREKIADLKELLASPEKMNKLIASDLKMIKTKFPSARLTTFQEEEMDLKVDMKALVSKDETIVTFTRDGYVKRTSLRSYSSDVAPGLKDGDVVRGVVKCFTTDNLILITSQGNFLQVPIFRLSEIKWKDEGKHINEIGALGNNEKIIGGFVVEEYKEGIFVTMLSKNGQIKRTPLEEFQTTRIARTVKAFNLSKGDELVKMVVTNGEKNLLIAASDGTTSLFNENELEPLSLKAGGVKAIARLSDDAYLVTLLALDKKETLLGVIVKEQSAITIRSDKLTLGKRMGVRDNLFGVYLSNPVTLLGIVDCDRNKIAEVVLTNRIRDKIDFASVSNKPLGMKLKPGNLDLASKENISDISYYDTPVINSETKVSQNKKQLKKTSEEKKEKREYSLSDYIDFD